LTLNFIISIKKIQSPYFRVTSVSYWFFMYIICCVY